MADSSHARPHHLLLPGTTAALQAIPKAPEQPLPQRKSFLLKQARHFARILGRLRKKSSCQSKPKEKVSKASSSFASSHSEGGWRQIPAGSPAHRHPQSMISLRISPRPRLPATQKGILCAEDSSSRNIPREGKSSTEQKQPKARKQNVRPTWRAKGPQCDILANSWQWPGKSTEKLDPSPTRLL